MVGCFTKTHRGSRIEAAMAPLPLFGAIDKAKKQGYNSDDVDPIIQNNIKSTDHVAVVGIGGLGHMAIKFLNAWGCDVTAISSNPKKER